MSRNKYAEDSLRAQRKRREDKMCKSKTGYETREAALVNGQKVYQCPYCEMWHCSNSVITAIRTGGQGHA